MFSHTTTNTLPVLSDGAVRPQGAKGGSGVVRCGLS
ncbi:hypothetical protein E2C01_099901 [Portunus trituberculatus]|uniref:Uncharacterized protein n=1 Tax=Portunus trituberculatus TaxID=210409 RepID=A0A5B7KBK4_PORTR|nr:hypothetical protein [Portunus trituberculatus]